MTIDSRLDDDPEMPDPTSSRFHRMRGTLGPGLITGASDDDPSGIATYSQAGAQYGYALTWTMLFTFPLMAAAQIISARIGRTTGHGISGILRRHYPNWILTWIVVLLLFANTINLAADLGAMADATALLIGAPRWLLVLVYGAFCITLQIFMQYKHYVAVLKWLTLSLFAYFATVLVVHVDWGRFLTRLTVPEIRWETAYLTTIVAVFGTTISPYLFFWQAAEEVEDFQLHPRRIDLITAPDQGRSALHRIGVDTIAGMAFSNLVSLAIMVTTAATLHASGITNIETSAQAAEALRPIAGSFAFALFTLGIVGTGLLAVPVLAGSAAYALGEARAWPMGLSLKPGDAQAFYGTIAAATLVGMVLCFLPVSPIKALFWAAVVNGVVAVPLMGLMMHMAARPDIMGTFAVRGPLLGVGWIATAVMAAATVAMVWTAF